MKKICSKCKVEKDVGEFSKRKRNKDGLQYECKACVKVYDKQYAQDNKQEIAAKKKEYNLANKKSITIKRKEHYQENKEDIAIQNKQYYQENKEDIILYQKEYRQNNKEKIAIRDKEYAQANKEEIAIYKKKYGQANREEKAIYDKRYYQENKESIAAKQKEYGKEYRQANPEKRREACSAWNKANTEKKSYYSAKRRAAKLQRTVAWADLEAIQDVYADCEEINLAAKAAGCSEVFVVDHEIPLQGELVSGLHVHTNLQIITATENSKKKNHFPWTPDA